MAVEKYPNNRMLGHREIVDGKVPFGRLFRVQLISPCNIKAVEFLLKYDFCGMNK